MAKKQKVSTTSDPCNDPNWINMPMGVAWNTQKVDYCMRAKVNSPFYVNIIGTHWFAALNNSGNYGTDYSSCCGGVAEPVDPCPPSDQNSPYYQFITSPLGSPHDFCNSDYCLNATPHPDCACCPDDTGSGDGGDDPTDVETKFIKELNIDLSGILDEGENRVFSIIGDIGAKFELEVKNDNGDYYDFRTNKLTSAKKVLTVLMKNPTYTNSISFPTTVKGVNLVYTLTLRAISDNCATTKHVPYNEVRFGEGHNSGDIDQNASTSPNGITLIRTIKQGPPLTIAVQPYGANDTSAWPTMAGTGLGNVSAYGSVKSDFTLTITAAANHAIKIDRQPVPGDFMVTASVAVSAYDEIEGEDKFDGSNRSGARLVGSSGGGTGTIFTMKDSIGSPVKWAVGDRIVSGSTTSTDLDENIVLVSGVNTAGNPQKITLDQTVTIANDAGVEFIPPRHYRFPVDNAVGLRTGMRIAPDEAGGGTTIGGYKREQIVTQYIDDGCGGVETIEKIVPGGSTKRDGIEFTGTPTYNSDGIITSQAGRVCFQTPIGAEFTAATYEFQGHGVEILKDVMGAEAINITNLKAEILDANIVTTTINDVSANNINSLSDFDVASKDGIMDDISRVSGVNFDTSAGANPLVTAISSSSGVNITVTPGGHVLQNGQTVKFTGAAKIITLTGNIEIINVGAFSKYIYIDVDRFLTIASNA